ncbi:putative PurR-regulated permease PerM [Mesonia algae]|uniref:Putative PurR-regulated permease PerM n=1 Tax=Mesonia algae TaxID=213248 RepID=A0A2W7IQ05_9FLAO|nr:AI-2E family transporter [Mesonia algae]PZW40743.1 putative PurR-regulated permease PerM [Mesonia algae]
MQNKKISYHPIIIGTALILGLYFLIMGLIQIQGFLAPLVIAGVLSLLIYPLCKKLEKTRLSKSLACLISSITLFIISLGILAIVFFQFQGFIEEWPTIKENMKPKIEELKNFAIENTPINSGDIETITSNNGLSSIGSLVNKPGSKAMLFLSGTSAFIANYLLVFIYIFFLLRYRKRFLIFLIRLFPNKHKDEIEETSSELTQVISQYLIGKLSLMGILAIAYSIGLGISGVENFILVSIIASLLTLIPYIGNIIGFCLALAFGYLVSGEIGVLIGVIITFTISQFLESYVLQPYIIGGRVNLHPFLVILMVILGSAIWGIPGMILAVPLTAIFTTIVLHIPSLKLVGELFQNESIKKSD